MLQFPYFLRTDCFGFFYKTFNTTVFYFYHIENKWLSLEEEQKDDKEILATFDCTY